MSYTVRLKSFEGPLDLLLHLIEQDEMDIEDISISSITAQYLDYLATLRELDLEVTSDFLVMASTLLAIKTRSLLPRPAGDRDDDLEQESDPREELIQRLREYKKFKEVAHYLQHQQEVQGRVYTRPNKMELYQHQWPVKPLVGLDAHQLLGALRRVLDRTTSGAPPQIKAAEIKVQDMMSRVLRKLVLYPAGIYFDQIFSCRSSPGEIVVTFLAVLELLHRGQVQLIQGAPFAEIVIKPAEGDFIEDGSIVS